MLIKMTATGGLLIAATAGALVTCSPALAAPAVLGHTQTHLVSNKNRNWNGTENEGFNHIRLRLHNRNNNIAVARNDQERSERPLIIKHRDRDHYPYNGGMDAIGAPGT